MGRNLKGNQQSSIGSHLTSNSDYNYDKENSLSNNGVNVNDNG